MPTIKVIELIGTSDKNWEDAANNAVKEAQETVKGVTGLEVVAQTAKVEGEEIVEYRTTVKVAFLVQDNR
jgi:flavin-binding protein dodecin